MNNLKHASCPSQVDYLILGAGVTGLACATKLQGKDYIIVEKEASVGGYCRTIEKDGFVWDYSGHFFHFNDEEIRDMFSDMLNQPDIVYNNKLTKVFYKGRYIDAPFQYNIHQLNKKEFIDCLVGLFSIDKTDEYHSFRDMLYKKYGKGISERFLVPYNEKLYACDLDTLDTNAMGRFFPYAEPEEIIRGFSTRKKETYNSSFFYSKRGAKAFVEELMKYVNSEKVYLNTEVISVDYKNKTVITNKGMFTYNYLINTIPFNKLLQISGIETEYQFRSNQVIVFNMGFDIKADNQKTHWIYFPGEDTVFYRVGFYNNICKTERMSIYVEIGMPSDSKVKIEELKEKTLSDLKRVGIIKHQKLVSYESVVMNPAYVHITNSGNVERDRILKLLKSHDAYSIGRYGGWTYCSIEDCIKQAFILMKSI